MASIHLKNVQKRFGRTMVIEKLDLEIKDGEFVTLLGPSGCGKSTTLNMIAGLELCTSGNIYFSDTEVTLTPPGKRDVAMVFQSYALYPHLSIFDNIAFPLSARKVDRQEIKKTVEGVAEKLALAGLLHRFPKELSGGQRQRVALGRALVRSPKVFLFDEPLSNLDAALKVSTRSEIKKLHQDLGTTMIYVTHDQAEAMSLSDRIAIFNKGYLQQFDTPDGVYNRPANLFVATFIGSPSMNLFKGKAGASNTLVLGNLNLPLSEKLSNVKEGESLTIGVRPHQFLLSRESGLVPAEVVTVQPMGECSFLDVKMDQQRAIIRAEADFTVKPGETVYLSYDKEQVHYFDEKGDRL